MVPRSPADLPAERATGALQRLFDTWRLLLARAGAAVRGAAAGLGRPVAAGARTAATLLAASPGIANVPPRVALATAGSALLAGVAGAAIVSLAAGRPPLEAVAGATVAALWPLARLAVMNIVGAPDDIRSDDVLRGWSAGAIVFGIAWLPALRAIAWLAGIPLTLRALEALGVPRARSIRLIAFGFGFEAVGLLAVWIARSVWVAGFLGG